MDIRAQFEDRLTAYVKDTLSYIKTARDFCDQEQKWTSERNTEIKEMREIMKSKQKAKKKKKELGAVLEGTLKGLKELELFLDAVEKLAVTSRHVFSEQIFLLQGKSPETVQSVITDARIDAPDLIRFKRDAETFFRPLLHNVHILVFQLDLYIDKTEQLCRRIRQKWRTDGLSSVRFILNTSEDAMHQMLDHLKQLSKIRKNEHFRLAFLFQENAQKFIDVFGKRRSRMRQFLKDLEDRAVKLDRMKKGASISTVVGSLLGIVGGVCCIAAVFPLITAGASLAIAGASLGAITAIIGTLTTFTDKIGNRRHERNVQESLKSFTEDMEVILKCKDKAASVKVSSEEHITNRNMTEDVITIAEGVIDLTAKVVALIEACSVYKAYINAPQSKDNTSTWSKVAAVIVIGLIIVLDIYYICKEGASMLNGSETDLPQLIRCRVALWESEINCWEKICDSLKKEVGRITERQKILNQLFLP